MLFMLLFSVVGIMYWVLPSRDKFHTLEAKRDTLQMQKADMDTKIAQTDKLVNNKEELITEVDSLMQRMADPLHGENFDLESQILAKNNSLTITSVRYGPKEIISPSANGSEIQQYEYNLKQLVDIYVGNEDEEVESFETEHEVLKKTVTLDVNGSYLSVQKMLSDLNNLGNTYYVKSVNYSRNESQITKEDSNFVDVVTNEKATITIDVYFLDTDDRMQDKLLGQKG